MTESTPAELAVGTGVSDHDLDRANARAQPAIVPNPGGLAGVLGSGDHKTIGRLYIGFALIFGVASLGAWAYFGVDAMAAEHTKTAFLGFTFGQTGLVFLFLMPFFTGLATAIVPLQVGASTIAFPRAAAAAFWAWLVSAGLLIVSYLPVMDGGINGADKNATALTILALGGVVIALLLGSVCIITTVLALRAPGMTLDRVPAFSWSMVAAGGLWLLTLPVFVANLALIFIDAKYGPPVKYGVNFNQWGQLSWVVTQPQVFLYAVPALGIAADVFATFAQARQPRRGAVLGAIGIFAALGFGAYVQPSFDDGVFHTWPFVAQSMALVIPVVLLLAGMAAVVRHGKLKFSGPLTLSLFSLLLVLLAAVAAAPFGIGRLGLQGVPQALLNGQPLRAGTHTAPLFLWGVTGLLIVGAATGGISGLYYWSSKITGRKAPDGLGSLIAVMLLLAGVLSGLPFILFGVANKATGLADNANSLFVMSVAGAGIAALALVVAFVVLIAGRAAAISGGETVRSDPWGFGQSLEWACDSPPEPGNFGELAEVVSAQPLLDLDPLRSQGASEAASGSAAGSAPDGQGELA